MTKATKAPRKACYRSPVRVPMDQMTKYLPLQITGSSDRSKGPFASTGSSNRATTTGILDVEVHPRKYRFLAETKLGKASRTTKYANVIEILVA